MFISLSWNFANITYYKSVEEITNSAKKKLYEKLKKKVNEVEISIPICNPTIFCSSDQWRTNELIVENCTNENKWMPFLLNESITNIQIWILLEWAERVKWNWPL